MTEEWAGLQPDKTEFVKKKFPKGSTIKERQEALEKKFR